MIGLNDRRITAFSIAVRPVKQEITHQASVGCLLLQLMHTTARNLIRFIPCKAACVAYSRDAAHSRCTRTVVTGKKFGCLSHDKT